MAPTLAWQHIGNTARQAIFIILLSMVLGAAVNLIRPDGIPFVETWSMADKLVTEEGETLSIPLEDAAALFADNAAVFLDARSQAEYDRGQIPGAVNLPWLELTLARDILFLIFSLTLAGLVFDKYIRRVGNTHKLYR